MADEKVRALVCSADSYVDMPPGGRGPYPPHVYPFTRASCRLGLTLKQSTSTTAKQKSVIIAGPTQRSRILTSVRYRIAATTYWMANSVGKVEAPVQEATIITVGKTATLSVLYQTQHKNNAIALLPPCHSSAIYRTLNCVRAVNSWPT